ncbi:hypothetical protein B0H13DRAFT_2269192 [Mycena leptocephala]|nr:hypothetical protein B0H13DRAFT_2269192 [Mycena leptocephala]
MARTLWMTEGLAFPLPLCAWLKNEVSLKFRRYYRPTWENVMGSTVAVHLRFFSSSRTRRTSRPPSVDRTPMLFMLSAIEADRARLADIEAQILHLERSRSGFSLIPTMLSAFGAERARVADMEAQMRHLERTLSQLHAEKRWESLADILTKICQWRDVALTTPELWRAIRLSGNTIPSERQSHIANIWLIRPADSGFLEVPLLRTVVLTHPAAAAVTLPWGQLTSLTLRDLELNASTDILHRTSNLVHCHLRPWNDGNAVEYIGPDIVLPSLESLTFHRYSDPVTGYLQSFVVPALRSLRIPEQLLGWKPINSLRTFISKSGCKLQAVDITGRVTRLERSYRRAFPSIPRFSFNGKESEELNLVAVDEDSDSE